QFTGFVVKHVLFAPGGGAFYAVLASGEIYTYDATTLAFLGAVQRPSGTSTIRFNAGTELQFAAMANNRYLYATGINGWLFAIDTLNNTLVNSLQAGIQLEGIDCTAAKCYAADP